MNQNRSLFFLVVALIGCGGFFLLMRRAPQLLAPRDATRTDLPSAAAVPAPKPVGPPVVHRQFAEMRVEERNAILEEIKKQDILTFFHTWVESGRTNKDLMKQNIIGALLGRALRETADNTEVLEAIKAFLANDSNSPAERTHLLRVLGQAANKEAINLLVYAATTLRETEIKQVACREISFAAGERWEARFHEELSPTLEQVWHTSSDQPLLTSVAIAIGKVGAPKGVDLLVWAASSNPPQNDFRARAAARALSEVKNPNAVPALAAILLSQPSTGAASRLASDTLAGMGIAPAGNALLSWLQIADATVGPLVHRYVVQTRTEEMLQIWQSAISPTIPFRSESNREAVRLGLIEYHRSISHEIPK
jgi:HEAT repeat protein